jgi:hypothetical protein
MKTHDNACIFCDVVYTIRLDGVFVVVGLHPLLMWW